MTTDTLVRNRTLVELGSESGESLCFGGAPKLREYAKKKNGVDVNVLAYSEVPVFRSGTFRDSMGIQSTWSHTHMLEMQSHFHLLKDTGVFEDVPIRAGHGSIFGADPLLGLIGYVTNLQVRKMTSKSDGNEYSVLLADYEILDEDAQKKIKSGLWKNRSAEIGDFVTNDEQVYGPTFVGFAYVDRPAVEFLNSFSAAPSTDKITIITEEKMTDASLANGGSHAAPPAPNVPAATPAFQFRIGEKTSSDPAEVMGYISKLEGENVAFSAQVQGLTEFRNQAVKAARHGKVKALAEGDHAKVMPTAVDSLIAYADTIEDEAAFTAWLGTFDHLPDVGVIGELPNGNPAAGQHRAGDAGVDPVQAQFAADKQILRDLRSIGRTDAELAESSAFGRIRAADPTFLLTALDQK